MCLNFIIIFICLRNGTFSSVSYEHGKKMLNGVSEFYYHFYFVSGMALFSGSYEHGKKMLNSVSEFYYHFYFVSGMALCSLRIHDDSSDTLCSSSGLLFTKIMNSFLNWMSGGLLRKYHSCCSFYGTVTIWIQKGSEIRPFEIRKYLKSGLLEGRVSNGPVFKWLGFSSN